MKTDCPVIKTFILDNKYFFYDTYKNQILHISKKQFREINRLMNIGLTKYISLKEKSQEYLDVLMLINKGYLKGQFIEEILHPETPYIKDLLSRGINDLTLQVTQDCNFKCRYCSFTREHKLDRNHEKINMTWDIAKSGIDFLYNHSKDSDVISLSFYGGEPLLNFELIYKSVLYAERIFQTKTVNFYMTLNASLLNQHIIDFLVEHNFTLLISLDGPPLRQNKHRKFYETGNDTFDIVMSNVNKIKETNLDYFQDYVSFAPVIFSDESLDEIVSFFSSIGVDGEKVSYTYANMSGIDYIESDLINNTGHHKEYYFDNKEKEKIKNKFLDKSTLPSVWHPYGPCIPGFTKLFLDIYGDFYPCEKVIASSITKIGNIKDGIDHQKVYQHMNIGKLTEEECKHCWAIRLCEMCIVRCIDFDTGGINAERKRDICKVQKSNIQNYITNVLIKENLN